MPSVAIVDYFDNFLFIHAVVQNEQERQGRNDENGYKDT
jgi:hypothetical protein